MMVALLSTYKLHADAMGEMRGAKTEMTGKLWEMKSSVVVFMSDVVGMAAREAPRSFVHVIDQKD